MEEIKVNEYVRTKGGHIRKVSKIMPCYENELLLSDTYYIEFDGKGNISTYKNKQVEEFITKHSPNIIDLIEEGDYVNGMKAQEIIAYGIPQTIICIGGGIAFPNSIKSIVTKEQFNQMKYIVGDE